jgi:uncharacterized protein (DUF1015 family)
MAEVHPFRGWRYDLAQVGSLADVAAPPYDVIGTDQQKELYERHPCNVVRLILNRDEPGDESADERYNRAAEFLRHWQSEGILFQERAETFYVYHQKFQWEGVEYVRKGFLGRLRLEEFGKGNVFPHEQTMAGPKADRLKLTQACQMNLSPIFSLYPDDEAYVQTPLEEAIAGQTALEVTDDLGVLHRIWPMTDPAVLNQVRERMAEKSIFIADGHHRYETAVNYRNFLQSEGKLENEAAAANFVLMMFVGMNDPGLAILPTHRLISGLPNLTADEIREALSPHFQLDDVGTGAEAAKETWEMMEADGEQNVFGFGTAADGKWLFARLTDASPMTELAPDQSEDWRQLGVSLLHKLVLDHLLKRNYPDSEQVCKYVHLLDEVTACLSERSCQLACLVAPAQIEDVEVVASKFEKMPPKSTFFYPKLLSGLVFNPLA